MSEFNPTKLNKNTINGGARFDDGNALSSAAVNAIVEGVVYNSENLATNIKDGTTAYSILQKNNSDKQNASTGGGSVVFGAKNDNNTRTGLDCSLVVGYNNKITNDTAGDVIGLGNIIGGKDNQVKIINGKNTNGNIIVGRANKSTSVCTQIVGENNEVDTLDGIVVGYGNKVESQNSLSTSKKSDTVLVFGNSNYANTDGVKLLGTGLKVTQTSSRLSTVVGKYNEDKQNLVFAVGNGTSDTNRHNAFDITSDGSVKAYKEPTSDNEVIRKKEIDETNKIALKNKADINTLFSALQQDKIIAVAEDVENTSGFRQTADGELNGIVVVDNSYTKVKKIQGDTVKSDNFAGLKSPQISGIKSTGKNLIPYPYAYQKKEVVFGITFEVQEDGGVKVSGTATNGALYVLSYDGLSKLPVGKDITISGGVAATGAYESITVNIRKIVDGEDNPFIDAKGSPTTGKLMEGETAGYVGIYVSSGKTVNATVYPMINFGTTALPYEPYVENTMQLPQSVELGKWDYIENGKLVKRTKTLVFTGKEIWNAHNGGYFTISAPKSKNAHNGISTPIKYSCSYPGDGVFVAESENYLFVGAKMAASFNNDEDLWQKHLEQLNNNGTPLTIAYETAEPIEIIDLDFDNQYLVWDKGTETVIGNSNAEYGANPTIVNDYMILGGAE